MATYTELPQAFSNDTLRNKIQSAICIKAQALLAGTPTADQKTWAIQALRDPAAETEWLAKYAIAANANLTLVQITGAADSAVQTNVDAAIDAIHPAA